MKLYIIRHAEVEGQDPKAKLTAAGKFFETVSD